jgi:predicted site-specific integrase-resolvase
VQPVNFLRPREVAHQFQVKPGTVSAWIRNGTLRAVDVSERRSKRPRWRISPESIAEFLAVRSSRPSAPPTSRHRRPRKQEAVIQFF